MAMTTSRRPFASFEKRSVLLFTALALGGAGALHAQQSPGGTAPGANVAPAARAVIGPAPSAAASNNASSSTASQAAFSRADTNHDGQLSVQEAATLPAIGNRFKELDADGNGRLSSEEFQRGAQQP